MKLVEAVGVGLGRVFKTRKLLIYQLPRYTRFKGITKR
jgi:hypothetical protein